MVVVGLKRLMSCNKLHPLSTSEGATNVRKYSRYILNPPIYENPNDKHSFGILHQWALILNSPMTSSNL